VYFTASIFQTLSRLLVWLRGAMRFFGGNLADALRGQASIQRRAERLRRMFEEGGTSFAKIAQQLSIRADILPYEYCTELSKMLDEIPAFPTPVAIEIIERNLGQKLDEVFTVFDPEPIGSASLAVVFQAQLRSGERVAVKVRRPGIGVQVAADLRALD